MAIPDYAKYAKDTLLVVVVRAIEWIEPVILLPILTKTLGVQHYGIWSQLNVTTSLLVPVALLGLGAAMERFLGAQANRHQIGQSLFSVLTVVSLVSLLFSILMFFVAMPLATIFFGGAEAAKFIKIAAFLVFILSLNSVTSQYFVARRQIRWYTSFNIMQIFLELLVLSYLALSGFGLFNIIIATMAIRALLFVTGLIVIKRQIPLALPCWAILRPYLVFGLPLLLATVCFWLLDLSNRYIIGYFLDISSVGIYSVSYQIGSIVNFYWAPIGVVLLPAIAPLYEKGDIQSAKIYLSHSLKFFLVLTIPSVFGLSILSKSILKTLTTPEFIQGYLVILIVAMAKAILSVGLFYQTVLMLAKRTNTVSILYAITAVVNLTTNVILVPRMGILGAATATLASFIIHFVMLYTLGTKELTFEVDLKFIMKSFISAMVMGAVIYFINSVGLVNLLISVVVGAAVYFIVLILLRGFTRHEYNFLRKLFKPGE